MCRCLGKRLFFIQRFKFHYLNIQRQIGPTKFIANLVELGTADNKLLQKRKLIGPTETS